MHPLLKLISQRLRSKGLRSDIIPTYLRDVANIYFANTATKHPRNEPAPAQVGME